MTASPIALVSNACAIPLLANGVPSAIRSCCGADAPVVEWFASSDQTCRLSCPAADQTVSQLSACLQSIDPSDSVTVTCSGSAWGRASLSDIALAQTLAAQNEGWCSSCAVDVLGPDGTIDPATSPIQQTVLDSERTPRSRAQEVDEEEETPSSASALGFGRKERRNKDRIMVTAIALILVGSAMGTFC